MSKYRSKFAEFQIKYMKILGSKYIMLLLKLNYDTFQIKATLRQNTVCAYLI